MKPRTIATLQFLCAATTFGCTAYCVDLWPRGLVALASALVALQVFLGIVILCESHE